MLTDLFFYVPGEPQGKGRPRFVRRTGHTYTPDKTTNYESWVRTRFIQAAKGDRFFDVAPLGIRISINYAIPKSVSNTRRHRMLTGEEKPTKKPDADNVLKIILDALNRIAYRDDAQFVYAEAVKRYREEAGVEVHIWQIANTGKPNANTRESDITG